MLSNESTRSFLDRYWSSVTSPEYAVLITGNWGSGKTWFVRNFLENHEPKLKYLYVSLYGVTTFSEIEDEFFRQIHPVLSSKPAKVVGKLLRGVLKTTLNFDLNADGKPDGSVSAGIPSESFFEKSGVSEGTLLVFDDVERCSIQINDLMGYINQFVEHGGFKCILIANEKELSSVLPEDRVRAYGHIKEKLVGHSFEILPDLDAASSSFVENLTTTASKALVTEHQQAIKKTYIESDYKNLRVLKQGLLEFDIFFGELSPEITKCKPLIDELFTSFFAYTFELRSGGLTVPEVMKLSDMSANFAAQMVQGDPLRQNSCRLS